MIATTKSAKKFARSRPRKLAAEKTDKKKTSKQIPIASVNAQYEKIYAAVGRIPRGKVCTYGAIAELAGLPGRARLAGTALKHTPTSARLAWHRVITASGRTAFPIGSDAHLEQRRRLEREGVRFTRERVDLEKHIWPDQDLKLDELLWRP